MKIRLFLFCLALGLMAPARAQAQRLVRANGGYETTLEKSYPVGAGGTLDVDRVTGSVTVRAWREARVLITEELFIEGRDEAEARRIVAWAQEAYRQQGTVVSVWGASVRSRDERSIRRRFTIRVPERFTVKVGVTGGAITVEGITGRVMVATTGGSISLAQIKGEVEASTAGGGIEMRAIGGAVEAATAGGSITLEDITGPIDATTAGGGITIRKAGGNVEANTAGGSIEITGVAGRLDASTAGGGLRLHDIRGDLDASTAGGDIDLRNLQGRARARTYGGDIRGRAFGGALDLETSAGDIDLSDVRAPVEAITSVGDIRVAVTLTDGRRPHAMRLRTSNGDIRLTLPPRLPATLDVELDRRNRYGRHNIVSDFALERGDNDSERILRRHGKINGGGDRIELRTEGGDIHIRKGGS